MVDVGLVSASTLAVTVPPSPRSLTARAVNRPSGTSRATEEAAIPNPSRSLATGGRRVTLKAIARPAASSTITVQARKMPNAGATRCRTSSGIWFFVNASCVSAQTITGAAPALATATSVTVRRRSGTIHSHSSAAMAAAPSAPRE